jgi:outer membrane protein insertion porin family
VRVSVVASPGGRLGLAGLGILLSLGGGLRLHAQETPPSLVVLGLKFQGNKNIPASVLAAGISTTNSGWFARFPLFKWLGLGEKRYFNEREFVADVLRIQAIYKYSGFLEVEVDTAVRRSTESVKVTFRITEGPPIVVTELHVKGIDSVRTKSAIVGNLPLREGQPFNRYLLAASADSIVRRLRNRGYPAALVFRNFDQNAETRQAQVSLEVVPGPLSRIESIRVEGTSPIDTGFVRRMVPAKPGRLFSQDELFISQRNLYRTELFQFASVQIDSTNFPAGDSTVPLVARVREGRTRRIRGSMGYGTTDCFRGGAGWRVRNFTGGARILDLSGRLSKVGVAAPLDANLEDSICGELSQDSIGSDKLNYNLTASLEQPGFLGSLNTGTLSLFADRRSEFRIYLREEIGASATMRREGLRRIPLTLSYKISYGATEASPANFCAFFSACTSEDVSLLREKRFLGTVTGSVSLPRVNNVLDPSDGHFHTLEATVSSVFLGSAETQEFVKLIANGAWYRELDRDIVLSWRLRVGAIFAPRIELASQAVNFVPPEERFYAGGPNDVRGFQRNELGPLVYVVETDETDPARILQLIDRDSLAVRFSATGGNTLAVGNVELRIPSPLLTNRMRLAFFIDAGTVWERGKEDVAPASLRITPGIGFRIGTPLGPARLDIAYNRYDRQPGALYRSSLDTGDLEQIADNFASGNRSNITFQFAIGQPF